MGLQVDVGWVSERDPFAALATMRESLCIGRDHQGATTRAQNPMPLAKYRLKRWILDVLDYMN
ncbi:hypothetical protein A7326_02575 [Stenotrophomonas maltophilia]|nr:hypothetical protein A7326_02575 [Stenotrophomonas maltophilia]